MAILSGLSGLGLTFLNTVAFDFAVKRRSVDVQNFGTAGDIPVIVRQYLSDVGFFYFL